MSANNFFKESITLIVRTLIYFGVLIGMLISACSPQSEVAPSPTQTTTPQTFAATEQQPATAIPQLDVTRTQAVEILNPTAILTGEASFQYLIYGDPKMTLYGTIAEGNFTFLDATNTKVTVPLDNVEYDPQTHTETIFDANHKPTHTLQEGKWIGVSEEDVTTHFIREKNLNGRAVNWNKSLLRWELSMPLTNEQVAQLGPEFHLDENDNLIYEGSTGAQTVIALGKKSRDLTIHPTEDSEMSVSPEQVVAHAVNGIDVDGKTPIRAILVVHDTGWGDTGELMYNPHYNHGKEFITVADVVGSRSKQFFADLPSISYEEVVDGSLLRAVLLHPVEFTTNSPIPTFNAVYVPTVSHDVWLLSTFNDRGNEIPTEPDPDHPDRLRFQYTYWDLPFLPAGQFRLSNPLTGNELPLILQQYHVGNNMPDLILHVGSGIQDEQGGGYSYLVGNPPRRFFQPIISADSSSYCGVGGLDWTTDQTDTICNLIGYGVDAARSVLPKQVQDTIANTLAQQIESDLPAIPVPSEALYPLQGMVIPGLVDYQDFYEAFVTPR